MWHGRLLGAVLRFTRKASSGWGERWSPWNKPRGDYRLTIPEMGYNKPVHGGVKLHNGRRQNDKHERSSGIGKDCRVDYGRHYSVQMVRFFPDEVRGKKEGETKAAGTLVVKRDTCAPTAKRYGKGSNWYPQGESNPCLQTENLASWATRRWGLFFCGRGYLAASLC